MRENPYSDFRSVEGLERDLLTEKLFEEAGLPAGAEVDLRGVQPIVSWRGGEDPSKFVDRISSLLWASPTFHDGDDEEDNWGWHFFSLTTRWRPSAKRLGYAVLLVAMSGPCGVCQDPSGERGYYAFDAAMMADGETLEAHPQLVELEKLVGGVEEAAELAGALAGGLGLRLIEEAICNAGHLSGIFESARALSE